MKPSYIFLPLFVASFVGCGDSEPELAKETQEQTDAEAVEASLAHTKKPESKAKFRSFLFNYDFRLHGLKPGAKLNVWLPKPPSSEWQEAKELLQTADVAPSESVEGKYGNKIRHFAFVVPESGETYFQLPYEIKRKEVRLEQLSSDEELGDDAFLTANKKVPVDGKAVSLLDGVVLPRDPLAKARAIYDLVDSHVKYSKDGEGWGQGDSEWVCDSQFGNCTDFHSLFISLARSKGIRARFEIGFPISADVESGDVGGYHCWGWFFVAGKGWVPVDISEADKHPEMKEYYFGNLTADRVAFSVGRDLLLEPPQNGPPLNFFVYPYAEVDGEVVERANIELQFSFESQP